mmetsp:Transcript_19073/g.31240  ORF Transcript_19073/g.31240 Transcript_19073/m.31240 type:complete len:86 (-) Transcript_19073:47-304(-)
MFGRLVRTTLDKEPAVAFAFGLAGIGIATAFFAPRIRYQLGYDTDQYFGFDDPETGKLKKNPLDSINHVYVKEAFGENPTHGKAA